MDEIRNAPQWPHLVSIPAKSYALSGKSVTQICQGIALGRASSYAPAIGGARAAAPDLLAEARTPAQVESAERIHTPDFLAEAQTLRAPPSLFSFANDTTTGGCLYSKSHFL